MVHPLTPATRKDRGVPLVFNEIEFSLLRRLPESNGLLKVCKVHAGKVMGNGLLGSMLGIFGIGRWNSCGKPLIDHILRRFNVITVNLGNVKTRILPEKNPMARSYWPALASRNWTWRSWLGRPWPAVVWPAPWWLCGTLCLKGKLKGALKDAMVPEKICSFEKNMKHL